MHIAAMRICNFRRLKNVLVDLANDISIFVGSNNSGKTSTAHVLQMFLEPVRDQFSLNDFSADCRAAINSFGDGTAGAVLPAISIELWLAAEGADLHRVIDLLPSLDWEGTQVGIRVEFSAADAVGLLARYNEAKALATANIRQATTGARAFFPRPQNLSEYLEDFLNKEFELKYFVLDRAQFNASYVALDQNYQPRQLLPDKGRSGRELLKSLVRLDILNAQRHLSDKAGGHRAEDLSRHLSRFYNRNLERRGDDFDAMQALAHSETLLNDHLASVFGPTLESLSNLGYPGIGNPRLLIRSALNPSALMNSGEDGAKVFYALENDGAEEMVLPDKYNGLGFKNLIYMVIELLDRHAQWLEIEEDRPPLHLVFIEEPEVHLHAQLQQVFIRKIMEILRIDDPADAASCRSQFIVTTHSPHVLYERGFNPVRYFKRVTRQTSEVLNLSAFYMATDPETRQFLQRYLKLTHCDLFFADAAVLVEGNVERLLLPQMIESVAPRLKSSCLSILEVGGAFAHRFRLLVEFLGLPTLVITDIDSVSARDTTTDDLAEVTVEEEDAEEGDDEEANGKACTVLEPGAVTANQTLIQWLPGQTTIAGLLAATEAQRTQISANGNALVRVVYQCVTNVTWQGETSALVGRTLEEAFALENLAWCQHMDRRRLKLRIRGNATKPLTELAGAIHEKVKRSGFKKTDFALALLAEPSINWIVPKYIADGLRWLDTRLSPPVAATPAAVVPEAA